MDGWKGGEEGGRGRGRERNYWIESLDQKKKNQNQHYKLFKNDVGNTTHTKSYTKQPKIYSKENLQHYIFSLSS